MDEHQMDEHQSLEIDNQKMAVKKTSWLMRPIEVLAGIFVPIIPVILAGGLLMAVYNLLTTKGLFYANLSVLDAYPQYAALAEMLNMLASAPFVLLPVLVGFSATRTFGGNAFLGGALGMIMVHPALLSLYEYGMGNFVTDPKLAAETGKQLLNHWHLIDSEWVVGDFTVAHGHLAQVGFQGSVLPVVLMSWVLAKLEQLFHRITPSFLDVLIPPLLALFVTAFITFFSVGPIFRESGSLLAQSIQFLYETGGAMGSALLGMLYAPIAITGLNHSFPAVEFNQLVDIAKTGGSFILPILAVSAMAQGGSALAALFTTKDVKLRSVASAGGISAMLGVAEPAMFGVNLKLRYPFFAAMIAAGLGAAYIGYTGTKSMTLGTAGIPSIASIDVAYWTPFLISMAIAFGCAFVGTIMLSRTTLNPERQPTVSKANKTEVLIEADDIDDDSKINNNKEIADELAFEQTLELSDSNEMTKTEVETKTSVETKTAATTSSQDVDNETTAIETTAIDNNTDIDNSTVRETSDIINDNKEDVETTSPVNEKAIDLAKTPMVTTATVAGMVGAGVVLVDELDTPDEVQEQIDAKEGINQESINQETASSDDANQATADAEKQDDDQDNNINSNKNINEEVKIIEEGDGSQFVSFMPDWIMPIAGEVVALSDVPDESFASGDMGAGFAINPTDGTVIAPVTSIVSAIFPDNQAICLENQRGLEILIYVGVGTDSLEGQGFEALVEEGNVVPAGIPLLQVDLDAIRDKVPSLMTSVLFTAMIDGEKVTVIDGKPMLKVSSD